MQLTGSRKKLTNQRNVKRNGKRACRQPFACCFRLLLRNMKKILLLTAIALLASPLFAQKVDSIYFHLYTDSLKKGQHNYINVDGKLSNGRWLPLTAKEILFYCAEAKFEGNELIIPTDFKEEKVSVRASLRSNPSVMIEKTIWIKKKPDDELLPIKIDAINGTAPKKEKGKNQDRLLVFTCLLPSLPSTFIPLSLRRQVLHDQLLLNPPRAGRQQE